MRRTYSGLSKKMVDRLVEFKIGKPGPKPGTIIITDDERRAAPLDKKPTWTPDDLNNPDEILTDKENDENE